MIDLKEWLEYKLATWEDIRPTEVEEWIYLWKDMQDNRTLQAFVDFQKWKEDKTNTKVIEDYKYAEYSHIKYWLDKNSVPYDEIINLDIIDLDLIYHVYDYSSFDTFRPMVSVKYQGKEFIWGYTHKGDNQGVLDSISPHFFETHCEIKQ